MQHFVDVIESRTRGESEQQGDAGEEPDSACEWVDSFPTQTQQRRAVAARTTIDAYLTHLMLLQNKNNKIKLAKAE